MMLQIRDRRSFYSGLMFILFGVLFAGAAARYDVGVPAQMGPGWFPVVLGGLLILLGLLITLGACGMRADKTEVEPIAWREFGLVLLAIASFALLLPSFGAVLSITVMVVICAWAGREYRPLETVLVALALAVICDLVFIRGLGLPIESWPSFIGG